MMVPVGGSAGQEKGIGAAGGSRRKRDAGPAADSRSAPLLYLPAGPSGRGFLILPESATETTIIEFTPALARLLLALRDARVAQAHLPEPVRGWMSARQLAEAAAAMEPNLLPPEEQTIRAYMSKICKTIGRATGCRWRSASRLIEHRSMLGYRLTVDDLAIIDGTEAGRAPKQAPPGPPRQPHSGPGRGGPGATGERNPSR